MSRNLLLSCAVLCATLVACGGDPTPIEPVPVPDTPLKGTVAGKSFTAVGATARPDPFNEGKMRLTIATEALSCANGNLSDAAHLLLSTEWTEGAAYDLSLQKNLTFSYKEGDSYMNDVSVTGRVEIPKAPATGTGRIRIRASTQDHSVEGAIDVEVCDQ